MTMLRLLCDGAFVTNSDFELSPSDSDFIISSVVLEGCFRGFWGFFLHNVKYQNVYIEL